MSYSARVANNRIEGTPPERYFRCEVQVVDQETGDVEAEQTVSWRFAGPDVKESTVQAYVDRIKRDLLSDVENREGFDPQAIS